MSKHSFTLKKKDLQVIDFTLSVNELSEVECEINYLFRDKSILPYGMEIEAASVLSWLKNRFIPKNRRHVEKILSLLEDSDQPRLINLLKVTLGLSLTDDYWVVTQGADLLWGDYNLYRNDFSEALSLIAFTGYGTKIRGFRSSPEFTTDGMLKKCWRRIEGKVYLYKGGTEGYANAGNEPYSEFYASQLAEALSLNHVKYGLEKWNDSMCSTCELFTSEDKSFVPAYLKYKNMKIADILKMESKDVYDQLVDMMMLDVLIINEDRHFGNFGAIRQYLTDKHRAKLRGILNFKLIKHPKYNLDDNRLKIINDQIINRARQLLQG